MENLLKKVYGSPRLKVFLKLLSHTAVLLSVISYGYLLYYYFARSHFDALEFIAISALPFALVSVLRVVINTERPYEVYDFYDTPPKNKKGKSFPSRHAFSVFLIATLLIEVYIPFGIALYVFAVLLALSRVLLGMHFVRDVLTGALIGVLSGLVALFL